MISGGDILTRIANLERQIIALADTAEKGRLLEEVGRLKSICPRAGGGLLRRFGLGSNPELERLVANLESRVGDLLRVPAVRLNNVRGGNAFPPVINVKEGRDAFMVAVNGEQDATVLLSDLGFPASFNIGRGRHLSVVEEGGDITRYRIDLVDDARFVSRDHAEVAWDPNTGVLTVTAKGRNGTLVNGRGLEVGEKATFSVREHGGQTITVKVGMNHYVRFKIPELAHTELRPVSTAGLAPKAPGSSPPPSLQRPLSTPVGNGRTFAMAIERELDTSGRRLLVQVSEPRSMAGFGRVVEVTIRGADSRFDNVVNLVFPVDAAPEFVGNFTRYVMDRIGPYGVPGVRVYNVHVKPDMPAGSAFTPPIGAETMTITVDFSDINIARRNFDAALEKALEVQRRNGPLPRDGDYL